MTDRVALDAAAGACRTAAAIVRADADERARLAASARVEWRGPHREVFDERLARHERLAHAFVVRALLLAVRLEGEIAAR